MTGRESAALMVGVVLGASLMVGVREGMYRWLIYLHERGFTSTQIITTEASHALV